MVIHKFNNAIKIVHADVYIYILLLYFIIGNIIIRDYGISMDEPIQRYHGIVSFNYITNFAYSSNIPESNYQDIKNYEYRDYGVCFEMICYIIELVIRINNAYSAILLRHILTFYIFWLSAFYFFRCIDIIFRQKIISIPGLFLYILHPRIFAEAFYNPKDIILLSCITIGLFFLIKFITLKSYKYIILLSFICGLSISTRVVGIILPVISILTILIILKFKENINSINITKYISILILFTVIFSIIFWPYLWDDPINHFVYSFNQMKHFRWNGQLNYWGNLIWASNLPWHYILSMILVTTPIGIIALFIIGLATYYVQIIKNPQIFFKSPNCYFPIFLFTFLIPIVAVICFKSVLYNGWRQLYFIYSSFIVISLYGIRNILICCKRNKLRNIKFKISLVSLLYISILIKNIVITHPFQFVYYNQIAGNKPFSYFDSDYFGVSYKCALEFLLMKFPSDTLNLYCSNPSGIINKINFKNADCKKLNYVADIKNADFYITNYYYPANSEMYLKYKDSEYPFNQKLIFHQEFRKSKIIGIYQLKF